MAAFASFRRSGWVRLLVVILCALFIFATIGAPPAQALGVESVAVFGLASVLSAATAALGFKLASNEQGQATLQKMVQDFKTVAWATGFVLVGSKLNGLQNGMDYIKMQVQNGKTYLDSRVFAWVQQWLAENGVYNDGGISQDTSGLEIGKYYNAFDSWVAPTCTLEQAMAYLGVSSASTGFSENMFTSIESDWKNYPCILSWDKSSKHLTYAYVNSSSYGGYRLSELPSSSNIIYYNFSSPYFYNFVAEHRSYGDVWNGNIAAYVYFSVSSNVCAVTNFYSVTDASNNTGLSGTDTLGKDVIDLTLDQILLKLKDWAQDWFDAGADSATNAATGALDLPLTVATGAATANPSIAEDGPLVWFPSFGVPVPTLRTGETDTKTVDQGKENASAAETSTVGVAENQTVIDSLVNWALGYISPDTGLFSKFPLCVPYDAYLLVTSSLGVGAVDSDSIFGASPGDLDGVVNQDVETYSDFQPIINIKHDFELDGVTYPLDVTIDLTPWQPLVTFFREGMALLLVAELIGSEFKRIRGH